MGWLWELTLIVSGALAWLLGAATLPLLAWRPLEDTLVEATESAVGAPPAPPSGIAGAARQAASAVARTAIRVMLLLVARRAARAQPRSRRRAGVPLAGVVWTTLFACAEYLDPPLARRGGALPRCGGCLRGAPRSPWASGWCLRSPVGPAPQTSSCLPLAVVAGTLLPVRWFQAGTLS